jgi:paraquat-inducible protein B
MQHKKNKNDDNTQDLSHDMSSDQPHTKIINIKKNELKKLGYDDFKDWISSENNVYIGRNMSFYVPGAVGSVWQNPYHVDKTKLAKHNTKLTKHNTKLIKYKTLVDISDTPNKEQKTSLPRTSFSKITTYTLAESLAKYRQHIESQPDMIQRLNELKGKTLGCWCKPSQCHGDILIELIEKYCN